MPLLLRVILYPVLYVMWLIKGAYLVIRNFYHNSNDTRCNYNVSNLKQLKNLLFFTFIFNINPERYYTLRLFKKNFSRNEPFMSNSHLTPILRFISRSGSVLAINDKFEFWKKLKDNTIRIPETLAIISKNGISLLKEGQSFPESDLFLKPVTGSRGYDCTLLMYGGNGIYNPEHSEFHFNETNLKKYLRHKAFRQNYILQPRYLNHPDLNDISNGHLCTCRIVTYLEDNQVPKFLFSLFMMPVGDSISSNTGAIWSAIDSETGILEAPSDMYQKELIDKHPQGGGVIKGKNLPFWEEVKESCIMAHSMFSDLHFIGWDVALCREGPVILEGNISWDLEFWQLNETFQSAILFFKSVLEEKLQAELQTLKHKP